MVQLKKKRPGRLPRIEVVDLFCGIGGLSYGMKSAGFHILAGFDLDHTCKYAYETNTKGKFILKYITTVTADDISPRYSKKLFVSLLDALHANHSHPMHSRIKIRIRTNMTYFMNLDVW